MLARALAITLTTLLASTSDAQTLTRTFDGDSAGDLFGKSVACAGDVDADGIPDLIIGSPEDDDNGAESGMARVYSGADGSTLYTFRGAAANYQFGTSVSCAGDVNGDGHDDVIVGAIGDTTGGTANGSARVYSGADGTELHAFFGATILGFFGQAVGGAGDVNADGYDDVMVAGPLLFGPGPVKVFSGRDGSLLWQFLTQGFGQTVDGAGDCDGDGFADMIVGSPIDGVGGQNAGSASVYSGFDGHRLFRYDGGPLDYAGAAVAGAGDVDGDGFDDVVIGAMQFLSGNAGYAVVLSGSDGTLLRTFTGLSTSDMYGSAVDGAGDVDGDGLSDVIIGAWSEDANGINAGSARVYSVLTGTTLITILGESAEDELGTAVAGVGDQDGDGFGEVLVGAPFDDDAGADAGRAFVHTGGFTGTPGKHRVYGVACAGSVGLPRMDFRGDSSLNAALELRLRGALPNTPAAMNIGAPTSIPLAAIGAPGCTLYVDTTGGVSLSIATDANGMSRLKATVPNDPLLVGNPLDFQWVMIDLTANQIGVVLSDAVVVTFGN